MVTEPLPDWMQKALLVGTYNDLPLLVQVDGLGNLGGGLGAYYDRYAFHDSETGTGGDATIDTDVVLAGERHIITNINAWHGDTNPLKVKVSLHIPGYYRFLFSNLFLLQNESLSCQGEWILKEGDSIAATFTTLGNGKNAYLTVVGYKIKVE